MSWIDIGLIVAYILVAIATIATIAFPIYFMINDPKQAIKSLISIGILVVVFLIIYAFEPGNLDSKAYIDFEVSKFMSKFIGSGIILSYILVFGAIGATVYSEAKNLFKN